MSHGLLYTSHGLLYMSHGLLYTSHGLLYTSHGLLQDNLNEMATADKEYLETSLAEEVLKESCPAEYTEAKESEVRDSLCSIIR